eukprot:6083528-Amphidinium_carterae.1
MQGRTTKAFWQRKRGSGYHLNAFAIESNRAAKTPALLCPPRQALMESVREPRSTTCRSYQREDPKL